MLRLCQWRSIQNNDIDSFGMNYPHSSKIGTGFVLKTYLSFIMLLTSCIFIVYCQLKSNNCASHSEFYYLNKNNLCYMYLKYLHSLKLQLNVDIPCSLFNRCYQQKHCVGKTTLPLYVSTKRRNEFP